ncbi:MAG: aminotransferase class I/II-fold pyridoxal phosphate-dependent enzyme, partial [Oscillospiraceae bacterium]|nr:aminotransferase class I/II-fold pyridoxal phosphate-dependent enzyme [Oscillospiraceae bacterium]
MTTPVWDFIQNYAASGVLRLHMPGHKGAPALGCEALDLTEVAGADSLYAPTGIIRESEANAAALFGSVRTLYSTEGSSQCIRAMVHLALRHRAPGVPPVILAGRNAHSSFLSACALCGAEPDWLWPEAGEGLLSCTLRPAALEKQLDAAGTCCAAVYVTSPDYLGGMADVAGLAAVCHARGLPLLVDNAHGAYLRFLPGARHPLEQGADLVCDSAHKTLPVLTGGAWLHIANEAYAPAAKQAMALFGSTSPSYLTLASLDLCNARLATDYPMLLAEAQRDAAALRQTLLELGWTVRPSDPLRITLQCDGAKAAARLRARNMEPEYAGPDALVLMLTPENAAAARARVPEALGRCDLPAPVPPPPLPRPERICSVREALFAPQARCP